MNIQENIDDLRYHKCSSKLNLPIFRISEKEYQNFVLYLEFLWNQFSPKFRQKPENSIWVTVNLGRKIKARLNFHAPPSGWPQKLDFGRDLNKRYKYSNSVCNVWIYFIIIIRWWIRFLVPSEERNFPKRQEWNNFWCSHKYNFGLICYQSCSSFWPTFSDKLLVQTFDDILATLSWWQFWDLCDICWMVLHHANVFWNIRGKYAMTVTNISSLVIETFRLPDPSPT